MKKMIGVSCLQSNPNYDLMHAAGIDWQRSIIVFPFEDKAMKRPSDRFKRSIEAIHMWRDNGFEVMGLSPAYGMNYMSQETGSLVFRRYLPDWLGSVNQESFYEIMEQAMAYVGDALRDLVEYYQIANELDITRFRGDMSIEQANRFMYVSARGLKQTHPEARVGINPSSLAHEATQYFYRHLYNADSDVTFDYAGIDSYFGSHHPGVPEDWRNTIDELHSLTGKPVVIQEWGYSSIGEHLTEGWPEDTNEGYTPSGENWICHRGAWKYAWKGAHTPEIQAEYYDIVMKIFAEDERVIGCFQYDWQDDARCFCGRELCPHECGWGMIDSEGRRKPAYYAFQKAVREYFQGH
jgi:hypothetical protein